MLHRGFLKAFSPYIWKVRFLSKDLVVASSQNLKILYMAGTIINEGFIAASLTLLSPICGKNDYQAETPSQLPQNFKYSQLQIGYLDQTQSDRFCRRHHVESNACWTVQQLMLPVVAVVV